MVGHSTNSGASLRFTLWGAIAEPAVVDWLPRRLRRGNHRNTCRYWPVTVLDVAATLNGIPYALGGGRPWTGANCDCSSYVSYIESQQGVSVPAFTDAVAASTPLIGTDLSVAQPGDILLYVYSDPSQPGVRYPHMELYAGGGFAYGCRWPNGSGRYAVLSYPLEVHRVDGGGVGSGPAIAGVSISPWLLIAGGVAAAALLDDD